MQHDQLPDLAESLAEREHIVVGPPGCGKTTYLTRQAERAATKFGRNAVAVCSLTRAAAAEVAGRDTTIPEDNIGTLHAHAYRALDRPPLAESGEGIKAWNETCGTPSWKLTGSNPDIDSAAAELLTFGADGDRLLLAAHAYRAAEADRDGWPIEVKRFDDHWKAWKDDTGRYDFTDLIEYAAGTKHMPCHPRIIMLDEAQDLSRLEMRLVRRWAAAAEQLVVVGDPDQALYTWRGADPQAVFGADVDQVRVLQQSYRVPAAVHEAAVAMIERVPDRLPVEYHPRLTPAAEVAQGTCETVDAQHADPGALRALIDLELAAGRTVMVLASCGYMLHPLISELREHGQPFHNPYRAKHGAWNPMRGARRLLAFLRPDAVAWPEDHRMWTYDDLLAWTDPLTAKGVMTRGSKTFIKSKTLPDRFNETLGGQSPPLNQLLEMFEHDHRAQVLDQDVEWWLSNLRHNERKRLLYGVEVYRRQGPKALHDTPGLTLGTIHSVKGGEADTVILFPDLSTAGYWHGLKTVGDAHDSVIRQMYVGMTRARERLILCAPSTPEHIEW